MTVSRRQTKCEYILNQLLNNSEEVVGVQLIKQISRKEAKYNSLDRADLM